jgi:hypothetical protein
MITISVAGLNLLMGSPRGWAQESPSIGSIGVGATILDVVANSSGAASAQFTFPLSCFWYNYSAPNTFYYVADNVTNGGINTNLT